MQHTLLFGATTILHNLIKCIKYYVGPQLFIYFFFFEAIIILKQLQNLGVGVAAAATTLKMRSTLGSWIASKG